MMQFSGEAEASVAEMSDTIQADTNTGKPKLGEEVSVAIVKVLLPRERSWCKGRGL